MHEKKKKKHFTDDLGIYPRVQLYIFSVVAEMATGYRSLLCESTLGEEHGIFDSKHDCDSEYMRVCMCVCYMPGPSRAFHLKSI